jgi:sporulation protein YlmC with PRC-barrel domain
MKTPFTLAVVGVAAASWAALAQTSPPAQPAPAAPATTAQPAADTTRPMFQMKQGQWRSSKLAGLDVYNNDEKIGDIDELILGQDGKIEAVVIGVGGFLGIGEHNVAVPLDQVKFVEEPRRTAATTNTGPPPAGTRPADTTGTVATTPPAGPAPRTATADTYRGYPDHAMVNMTKDQLKALPEVRYAR